MHDPFLNEYFDKDTTKVSDTEHIAFLAFRLSQYVFSSRSLQVPKSFVIIVVSNQTRLFVKKK